MELIVELDAKEVSVLLGEQVISERRFSMSAKQARALAARLVLVAEQAESTSHDYLPSLSRAGIEQEPSADEEE
jgi:hypothetical protein